VLFAAYAAAQLVASVVMGFLSDKFGRRPVVLLSLFGSVLGLVLQGVSWNMTTLVAFRVVGGLFGSMSNE
jgi:DHA1 family tetracycline resistance protein-like MFS transporter